MSKREKNKIVQINDQHKSEMRKWLWYNDRMKYQADIVRWCNNNVVWQEKGRSQG